MRCGARKMMALGVLTVAVIGSGATAAYSGPPIKPGKHFDGVVNGKKAGAVVVYTVCPGPIWDGRTGAVAGGQTMSVTRAGKAGGGYTGPFTQVYAWFAEDASGPPPQQLRFTNYGAPQDIPAAVRVPCDGAGKAVFSSCPYLAPCAAGWIPDNVDVTYVNIAA